MITQALPQIAAEVAAPLARTGEILIIGGNTGKFYFSCNKKILNRKIDNYAILELALHRCSFFDNGRNVLRAVELFFCSTCVIFVNSSRATFFRIQRVNVSLE